MPTTIRRQQWTRQPINPGLPVAGRFSHWTYAAVPAFGRSSHSRGASAAGLALFWGDNAAPSAEPDLQNSRIWVCSGDFTALMVFARTGFTLNAFPMIWRRATINVTAGRAGFAYTSSGAPYVLWRNANDSGFVEVVSTSGAAPLNTPIVFAAKKAGSTLTVWRNGLLEQTVSNVDNGTSNISGDLAYGPQGSGSACGTELYLASWSPVAVADVEMQNLGRNPWQLFAPRRILVPTVAASTLPTLSAATFVPGSLTSSGFRPRVTATWS